MAYKRKFLKSDRLLKGHEFKELFKSSSSLVGRYVVLDYAKRASSTPKLGISASKKFGKAHERNRFKRLCREAFRHLDKTSIEHLVMHLRPRSFAKKAKMQDIFVELQTLSFKCYDQVPTEPSESDPSRSPQRQTAASSLTN